MRYIQRAVCYCSACKKDITLSKSIAYPGQAHQTVDPLYEGWKVFSFKNKEVYICPKHTIELTLVVDGKKMKEPK